MLRDKNLIPLSHQHQHALALCVRIERASPIPEKNLMAWQSEIAREFESEISIHFAAEESVLFPAARSFAELASLIEKLLSEHAELRARFASSVGANARNSDVTELARKLSAHIRKEERQLFERVQALMTAEELTHIGRKLDEALKDASQVCHLPSGATRLRPAKPE